MKAIITPSIISGEIIIPASKSAMQRALALAWLHEGKTKIINPGHSKDDMAALEIIKQLGSTVMADNEGNLHIYNEEINKKSLNIFCGESGLSVRMFSPLVSLLNIPVTINGTGSLVNRPLHFLEETLPKLGVKVFTENGKIPLKIEGPMQPKEITVDGSLSSQYLTGLLMAFGKAAKEKLIIHVTDLKSKPYIDLTLQMMSHFGYNVKNNNYQSFEISPKNISTEPVEMKVEADWSSASLVLAAAAVAGENVVLQGLDLNSTQADKAFLLAMNAGGADLEIAGNKINVSKTQLKPFAFDATDCPDLFPPLVVLAAFANGKTVLKGTSRLTHKESNRALTLQDEFEKMGLQIQLSGDEMHIYGSGNLSGAQVSSRHDHRIAMACCSAALAAEGNTEIEDAEAIAKSYPDYYEHLRSLGALIVNT